MDLRFKFYSTELLVPAKRQGNDGSPSKNRLLMEFIKNKFGPRRPDSPETSTSSLSITPELSPIVERKHKFSEMDFRQNVFLVTPNLCEAEIDSDSEVVCFLFFFMKYAPFLAEALFCVFIV